MEPPKTNGRDNPVGRAGFFSKLSFGWVWPLIHQGYTSDHLEYNDLFNVDPKEHSTCVWKKLDREWTRELAKKKKSASSPYLAVAIVRAYGLYLALSAIPLLLETMVHLGQPILFRILIDHFSPDSGVSQAQAYMCAAGVALSMLIQTSIGPFNHLRHMTSKIQWKGGLTSLLYRKAMRLSNKTLKELTTGHIIDIITVDSGVIDQMTWRLHTMWRAPLHTIVALAFIYHEIGATVFMAVALLLTVVPLQILLARFMSKHREAHSKTTDERVTLMGEIISAIRVIKMYCWEKPFGQMVDDIRKKELGALHTIHKYATFVGQLTHFANRLVGALVVITYALLYGPLPAAKVFPMFMLLDAVCHYLLNEMAWGFMTWFQVSVSLKRVQEFLEKEEDEQSEALTYVPVAHPATPSGVTVHNMVASWDEKSTKATLDDVSLSVEGELLMVVGRVGAGKSSLLLSLLGELPITSGRVQCVGKMAYAAQQPWVFSSNIRRNILFGAPYDDVKYANVIEACSLTKDLDLLPHGDRTLVGERGVTLSGGQKARISLARALYSDADVYLLDDPLSAVDSAVSRHIFEKCINGYLKKKTRILVTHQLQYLSKADRILVLQEGQVLCCGSYDDVLKSGVDLSQLVDTDHDTDIESSSLTQISRQVSMEPTDLEEQTDKPIIQTQPSKEAEAQAEEDDPSGVSWLTLWDYFRAGNGSCVMILLCMVVIGEQLTDNFSDWFLAQWTNYQPSIDENHNACEVNASFGSEHNVWTTPDMTLHQPEMTQSYFADTTICAAVHTAIIMCVLALTRLRIHAFVNMASRSSRALHDMMYQAVTRAPSRFFDTNPKGRILNFFSGDVQSLDSGVPHTMEHFTRVIVSAVGDLIIVCLYCPSVFVAVVPVFLISMFLRTFYIRTQRHCKKLLSSSRSPMLSHLNATLEGMETIRAFKAESRCTRDFDMHHTHHMSTWMTEVSVFCWFIFLANGLGALYSGFIVFSCFMTDTALEAGEVGMLLRYAMGMCWSMSEVARASAELEMQMVKADRVLRYTRLTPEAPLKSEQPPSQTWPSGGAISFRDVCLRYDGEGAAVLKNINCQIMAGEKVGIVGRTGAGKSSLVQALFRMAEPSGQICIDGQVTTTLGLHDLRGNISIIPQDPVLFSGTVRRNLDPFDHCDTNAIWWALQEVQLKSAVEALSDGLDSKVHEGGTNFSVGQRQLFCLARALLRKNKILVLDEATANVDKHTDDMIQSTIRTKFQDCTVLTIAHRLNTVMESDRILVMDEGQVVEWDEPRALLADTNGHFYKMVQQTGPGEQRRLTSMASRDRNVRAQDANALRHRFVQSGEV